MDQLFSQIEKLFDNTWPNTKLVTGDYGYQPGSHSIFVLQESPKREVVIDLNSDRMLIHYYKETKVYSGKTGEFYSVEIEQLSTGVFQVLKTDNEHCRSKSSDSIPELVLNQIKASIELHF